MKKRGVVGIFVMNCLDFVDVEKCNHNDLKALTKGSKQISSII